MAKTKNAANDLQQNFNRYLEEQVKQVFGAEIGPDFRAFQHNADFNYFTFDGTYYSLPALHCLDSLLKYNSATGQFSLEESGFSRLYHNVLRVSRYTLSKATQNKVNADLLKYQAQMIEVIKYYPGSLPPLTSDKPQDKIFEIYTNCAEAFHGDVTKQCDIIPDSLFNFKAALQNLNNMQGDAAQMIMEVGNKNAYLSKLINNMENPGAGNAGLAVNKTDFYVGYEGIRMPKDLLDSLNTEDNKLTVVVSGEAYSSTEMNLHVNNRGNFCLPFNLLLDLEVEHKSTFDMETLKTADTTLEASITYSGLTKVPVVPAAANISGSQGWYAETTVLHELKEKSGADIDGYKLTGSEFDADKLFGKQLACLKSLLISKMPTISVTLSNIDMEYAHSVFVMNNDVTLTLFGFIKIGHNHDYRTENISFNDDESSVTLTFRQPDTTGTPDPDTAAAFVMGGVPYYPGVN